MNDVNWKEIKTWSKDSLRTAQKEFLKNPSSSKWTACLRAMMVWQQVAYCDTSFLPVSIQKRHDLEIVLSERAQCDWAERIVQVILNMSMEEALRH